MLLSHMHNVYRILQWATSHFKWLPQCPSHGTNISPIQNISWCVEAITVELWSLLGCGAGFLVSDIMMGYITFLLKGTGIVLGAHDPWEWRQYSSSKCCEPHIWQCSGASQMVGILTPQQSQLITTVYVTWSLDLLTREMLDKVPDALYLLRHIPTFTEIVALCSLRALTIFQLPWQLHNDPYKRTDNIFEYNFRKLHLKY